MEFMVTICLGGGDGGDVCVDVALKGNEYETLGECVRSGCDIEGYPGLGALCGRIEEAAMAERDYSAGEETDYSSATFIIRLSEEEEGEFDCEENNDGQIECDIDQMLEDSEDDFSELYDYLNENEDCYESDIREFAFREALWMGKTRYILENIDDIELNDDGDCSSYFDETEDGELIRILLEHGAVMPHREE